MLRRVAGTELVAIIISIADFSLFYLSSLLFISFIIFIAVYYLISFFFF